ncbi:MAG: glycoside hydrolase family protein [Janthinobacterium lividum]
MTTMHASTLCRRELGLLEATVLHTYNDATGTPTIGTGHTAAAGSPIPTPGLTITAAQADAILAADLAKIYEPAVNRRVTVPLATFEFDAVLLLTYNIGEGNLAKSDLLRCLNAGDRVGAAAGFSHFITSHGQVLDGLRTRRATERTIFLTGTYPGLKPAPGQTTAEMSDAVTLVEGAKGDAVEHLQTELKTLGFFTALSDGNFGPLTKHAVQAFQRAHGLGDDGIAGIKTGLALEAALRPPVPAVAIAAAKPAITTAPAAPLILPAAKTFTWSERLHILATGKAA